MRAHTRFLAVAVAALLAFQAGTAFATPVFSINTYDDWLAATAPGGPVQAVPGTGPGSFEAMVQQGGWPIEYENAVFCTPELYVMDSPNPIGGEPCLVMAWGEQDMVDGQRYAAAWDYVYPQDPDLSNMVLEFSIFPPVFSVLVSLNLIDADGNWREYIWHAGGEGELPPMAWSTLKLNPSDDTSNYPFFVAPFSSPAGFDLTRVARIRFDENIASSPAFPVDPGGQFPGFVWNAWDHVAVHPEPSTMLLVAGGLLALARRRRRKK